MPRTFNTNPEDFDGFADECRDDKTCGRACLQALTLIDKNLSDRDIYRNILFTGARECINGELRWVTKSQNATLQNLARYAIDYREVRL